MNTLREAIEQAVAILGPEAPLCSGCVEEWTEALRILNAALAEQPAEQLSRWIGDANIESPFNGCMYKGYCLSLKSKLQLAKEAAHHHPAPPELEAAVNAALGLDTPTVQQAPVAYWHKRGHDDEQFVHAEAVNGECPDCTPLFAAPQPAKRVPLTEQEIDKLARATFDVVQEMPDYRVNGDTWDREFARAIERAHGITGETE